MSNGIDNVQITKIYCVLAEVYQVFVQRKSSVDQVTFSVYNSYFSLILSIIHARWCWVSGGPVGGMEGGGTPALSVRLYWP